MSVGTLGMLGKSQPDKLQVEGTAFHSSLPIPHFLLPLQAAITMRPEIHPCFNCAAAQAELLAAEHRRVNTSRQDSSLCHMVMGNKL